MCVCVVRQLRVKDTNVKGRGKGQVSALHTMKAHSWSRGIVPLVLNQGTKCK